MTADTSRKRPSRLSPEPTDDAELSKQEYELLAQLRYSLREFARSTELEARKAGITPQQYQLLLAIKGFPGREYANISELAERLQIRHNAVIGLINRAEARGLVRRQPDVERQDRRVVLIRLTNQGEQTLQTMAAALLSERQRVWKAWTAYAAPVEQPVPTGSETAHSRGAGMPE